MENPHICTALVCLPLIYGVSSNKNGAYERRAVRQYVVDILKQGKGFYINEGKARWNTFHIDGLSQLFLILVDQAVQGGGKATWSSGSYYFAENGDVCFRDLAKDISHIALEKGYNSMADAQTQIPEEGNQLFPFTTMITLRNSRSKAIRARTLLGWEPVNVGVLDDVAQKWRFSPDEVDLFLYE
jgi:nucleoside-diphosphate-sugar epimerase